MVSAQADVGKGSARVSVRRVKDGRPARVGDAVAVEEPLEIRLGYDGPDGRLARSLSITMRTPGDDLALAAGFLFGEGIVREAGEIASLAHCGPPAPGKDHRNVVRVELAPGVAVDLARLERHFYTTSSCGVCGKTSLEALSVRARHRIPPPRPMIAAHRLGALPAALGARQRVFGETGGLHGAGLFGGDGRLLDVREDVGRHNALDKLVGAVLLDGGLPLAERGILLSGRASFELMQKALMAGCPLVAAVGAPSSLAVELAREHSITLVGFLRPRRFNIYAGEDRIAAGES